MVRRIHHLDVVVRDLDRAVDRYRRILGTGPLGRESLPHRGIDLARFRLGESWLILVQPTRADSPVAAFLEENGEGFFHIAFQVEDVESWSRSLEEQGIRPANREPRRGVEGWKLVDLEVDDTFGMMTQLVEDAGPTSGA